MSYTQVQICNLALTRMGANGHIQSLSEASEEAYSCSRLFDPTLRAALRMYAWGFATETDTLALLSETPDDYEYAYSLPSGCVRPLYILPKQDPPLAFEVRGNKLYTDVEEAVLKYTQYVDNPGMYDDAFVEAFSYRLAADLALPLASDVALQERMLGLAERSVSAAKVADAHQGKSVRSSHSDIVSARA